MRYFDAICKSPSQLYSFALPWCPSSSWLHKYYTAELLQAPRVIRGGEAEWGKCSRTVSLGSYTQALSYWNNAIAVGSRGGDIIILDAITGSKVAILSGHLGAVRCFTFSSDGKSLVSGSNDETVKLWDMQTGGIVKTFCGHTNYVVSVSISADCTMIASGSYDNTACLWDIQTQECLCIIEQQGHVDSVSFSPTDPQHIISISQSRIWQWDINGHQIPPTNNCHQILPTNNGSYITFSPDRTQFILYDKMAAIVQNSDSGAIVARFHVADDSTKYWCFSPHGRLVAATDYWNIYVWDVTNSGPHPIETFAVIFEGITALVFSSPSSLVSASINGSVKFWKIGTLSTDSVTTDPGPALSLLSPICSVSLQARAGIAISSDKEGVVRTWDISTGLCKTSFQTPAKGYCNKDVQLVDGRLISVWHQDHEIHIWDIEKAESLWTGFLRSYQFKSFRISGDGSKVFCLTYESIKAWSTHTGELMGEVEPESDQSPIVDLFGDTEEHVEPKSRQG